MIVLVPTYARPGLFARLVADLRRELHRLDMVCVLDDASPELYAEDVLREAGGFGPRGSFVTTLERASENAGKRGYWRTVNRLFDLVAAVSPEEPVAYLSDDLRLVEGWRDRVHALLEHAETHEGCIGLHAHRDGRTTEWGIPGGEPVGDLGERMGWHDGAFVTRVRWLDAMRPEEVHRRWDKRPELGSGAWRSSSYRTHGAGLWWLRPRETLCRHEDDGVSVMNPHATASESRLGARRVYTEE